MPRSIWLGPLLAFLPTGCPLPELGGEGKDGFEPPDQCNGGLTCIEGICIRPGCTRTQDCPDGQYCNHEFFECLDGCDHSDQCPPSEFCDLIDNECKRDPDALGQLGEPCYFVTDFGTTHPQANNCEANLMCIGYTNEGSLGYCDHAPEECWMVREVYNPDCVDGACGGSFCCALCSSGNCPGGYEPLELGSGECVCLPLPASANCSPVVQNNCPQDLKCVTSEGPDTRCIPIGYVAPGQPCDWFDDLLCQAGYMCLDPAMISTAKNSVT